MIDFVRCAFRVSIRKACRALPAYRTTYPLPVSPTRASISEKVHPRDCCQATSGIDSRIASPKMLPDK